jgi:hypothetical protein
MLYSVLRYVIPFSAILVFGPLACHFTAALRGVDGGNQASLLLSSMPMQGVIAAVIAFAIALIPGVLGALCVGNRSGLFSAGFVLAWAAWGTGQSDQILMRAMDKGLTGSPLGALALEGLIVGVLGVATAWVIMRTPTMRSALPEVRDPAHAHHHLPREPHGIVDSTLPAALATSAIVGAVAIWVIAQETLKGQTLGAAVLAGVLGAAGGRMASQRVTGVVFVAGLAILAAVGPAIAMMIHKTPIGAVHAAQAGKLFFLARVLPLDLMAGAFVGVPFGLIWAGSMIDKHQPATPALAAKRA